MSDNELADWAEAWAAKRQTQRLPDVVSDNLRAIAARLRELSAEVERLRLPYLQEYLDGRRVEVDELRAEVESLNTAVETMADLAADQIKKADIRHGINVRGSQCTLCGKTMVADNRAICLCGVAEVEHQRGRADELQRKLDLMTARFDELRRG